MKKKTWIILIAVAVVVLAVAGVGIAHAVLNRPGVHINGDTLRVNLELPCYVYNQGTGSFQEMSTVTWHVPKGKVSGENLPGLGRIVLSDNDSGIAVAAYALSEEGLMQGRMYLTEDYLSYQGVGTDIKYSYDDEGVCNTGLETPLSCYAKYDLSAQRLCGQLFTDEGEWLVFLTGFESQDAALQYLQGEGKVWTEKQFVNPPTN